MLLVVLVCLYVCLSVRQQDYLQSNGRICMKHLPDVMCVSGPRNNPLHFDVDSAAEVYSLLRTV